jgi:poly(A) polymerase
MRIFEILETPEIKQLFKVFHQNGTESRLVGGCVRDAQLGIKATDIDVAVNVPPDKAKQILEQAGIKVIPTGIDHGTITAVINKIPFQITSLRQDWQTFGRHAKVIFGTDWLEDAKRRDFTMNAIYLDGQGNLYDPFDGAKDLKEGIVRFIGEPKQRIQEDYLRILRYYRFLAYYGKDVPKSVDELSELKNGLLNLSKERIQNEFFKLLAAKDPRMSLKLMEKDTVFETLFGYSLDLAHLFSIIELELSLKIEPGLFRRLYALFGTDDEMYANSFCLSRQQKQYLNQLDKALSYLDRRYIYYDFGSKIFLDWVLLNSVQRKLSMTEQQKHYQSESKWLSELQHSCFPLSGADLLEAGFSEGPEIGTILKMCKSWWIELDFKPNKDACLKYCLAQK